LDSIRTRRCCQSRPCWCGNSCRAWLLLSFTYLASIPLLTPDYYSAGEIFLGFLFFYVWGFGFVGYANILARVSTLELEAHLEQQRGEYRRQLHDDLGNTLCGLHFGVQRLGKISQDEQLRLTLGFLGTGYDRAAQVLKHLLSWFEEPEEPIGVYLREMVDDLKQQYGVQVRLQLERDDFGITPEIKREVLRIIREAANNALRHCGSPVVVITAARDRNKIRFVVRDAGCGIDAGTLTGKQSTGSLGIISMRDRAAKIGADLDIRRDGGTRVTLTVSAEGHSGRLGRVLAFNASGPSGGLYHFLVRVKLVVFVLILVRALFLGASNLMHPPDQVILGLLCAENMAWYFFPEQAKGDPGFAGKAHGAQYDLGTAGKHRPAAGGIRTP